MVAQRPPLFHRTTFRPAIQVGWLWNKKERRAQSYKKRQGGGGGGGGGVERNGPTRSQVWPSRAGRINM